MNEIAGDFINCRILAFNTTSRFLQQMRASRAKLGRRLCINNSLVPTDLGTGPTLGINDFGIVVICSSDVVRDEYFYVPEPRNWYGRVVVI
jgi:hypothetical protein